MPISSPDEVFCSFCQRSSAKATHACELCEKPSCKSCLHFLDEATFSFLSPIPEDLSHTNYCPSCQVSVVEPELEKYLELMERARGTYVFFTEQKRPPPILGRALDRVTVKECPDRDETIMRLAFQAATQGCNSLIECDVVSKQVRISGYQKSSWSGVARPARVDAERLERSTRTQ